MRLSMMPTAKKKMGSMGMFVSRHADGAASGPTSPGSPRAAGMATSAPAVGSALQPSPQLVISRQDMAAAAKPKGRFASNAQAPPPPVMSSPPQHHHPMQRSRGSSDHARDATNGQNGGGIWEDSTVASMFDETDATPGPPDRGRGSHGRHFSDNAYPRGPQFDRRPSRDDHLPFVIGENGTLKVVPHSAAVKGSSAAAAAALNTGAQAAAIVNSDHQHNSRADGPSQDARHFDTTPTRNNTLRRTRLPHRDAPRDPKRAPLPERPEPVVPGNGSLNSSPGRRSEKSDRFLDAKVEDAVRGRERFRDREQRDHALPNKRSNAFDNPPAAATAAADDPAWNAPGTTSVQSPDTASDSLREAPQHTTPRPSRQRINTQGNSQGDATLARTSSRRHEKPAKKRRLSLDYNDAELNAMTYSDLQGQVFDFDPQAAALQQVSVPNGDAIEDKLAYYKDKDSVAQHQFFTQVSLDDWDAAGDWFLEQFSGVVKNMRQARRAKREITVRFEAEVAAREEAVRGKMEGIDHTLQDLKQEGQTMMEGKDIDV